MPTSAFFSSVNSALKKFAKQQGHDVSSLLEIDDIDLLTVWQGKLANNSNYVYNPRRQETKTQEGLRYYIDFLRNRGNTTASTNVTTSTSPHTNVEVVTENEIESATEGMMKEVTFFRSVRNRKIRNLCAERDKYTCQVCGFNFETVYGERGKGFIEIHHKNPMANFDKEHEIKLEDLVALCSNCHSMIHYGGEFLDVDDLKKMHKAQTDQYIYNYDK
jgi:predicted HNH restriction endonuclease